MNEYVQRVRAIIIQSTAVVRFTVVRETVEENVAVYRYRITINNGSLLEASERIEREQQYLLMTKYSFHWQDADGKLIARWDDAPHHPHLATFPYHVHDGSEENVQPHETVTLADVLRLIEERMHQP